MKKKNARRVISMVLMMVLVFQVIGVSAESTVTWEFNSTTYAATVSAYDVVSEKQKLEISKIYHEKGVRTQFPTGPFTVTFTGDMAFPTAYKTYLNRAAAAEGVSNTYTGVANYTNVYYVPAVAESGYYFAVTTVYGYEGSFYVTKFGATGPVVVAEDTYSFAPCGCSGVYEGLYIDQSAIQ